MTKFFELSDGTRVPQEVEKSGFHVVSTLSCSLCNTYPDKTLIILCSRAYCFNCYPKAVAMLEAEVKVEELKWAEMNAGSTFGYVQDRSVKNARRRMKYVESNPPEET